MTRSTLIATLMAAAGLAATPAAAAPEHLKTIERECGVQLKMPPGTCACMAERAGRLKDGQQAFVAAVVMKDAQGQAQARSTLTIQELTEAGMFMTNAPGQCAKR
jgi:hypothetical protein